MPANGRELGIWNSNKHYIWFSKRKEMFGTKTNTCSLAANFMKLIIMFILFLIVGLGNLQSQDKRTKKVITQIPNHLTKLERDSIGYLLYKPCDGSTPELYIESNNNYIIRQGQLESDRYKIVKVRKVGPRYWILDICDQHDDSPEKESQSKIYIKQIDRDINLWLIEWGEQIGSYNKWIMTSDSELSKFRVITNPCGERKEIEKKFLEIEY